MPCSSRGFGLVDVIVGIALLLVLFLALFGVLRASLMLSALAKAKASAVELAGSQMEYLRGLSYDSLGTVGGIPNGAVPQTAATTIDGVEYAVRTLILYVDDPADGEGAQDSNGITTDYKLGKVAVSYTMNGIDKSMELISNFTPPSIESSTGGGTLSIHIVDAANENVGDALVHIVNEEVSPSVDFTTFTDTSGFATIGGAATSSEYQLYVSRDGYSSAQTYARTGENVNPSPGYLTVTKDQVTGATFFIDVLSTLAIASFSPAVTVLFNDSFADSSGLASQTDTQVAGGSLILAGEALYGTARSTLITPNYLSGWGILSANIETPPGTSALIRIADADGAPLPDSALSGNSAGFSSFPVALDGISAYGYPSLAISAELTSNSTTTSPSVLDWSVSHTDGPAPLPDMPFTLTGAKIIGTDGGDAPIYKTIVNGNTGANAVKTETLEWDLYSLSLGTLNLIENCPAFPYSLAPASAESASIMAGALTANTLPLIVENSASTTLASARVVLKKSGFSASLTTSACGLAFFNGLSAGNYNATVSKSGYATTTFTGINVSGHAAPTTLTLP